MLRTVIYIRKSSEDETEKQAWSFDRQWRDLEDFIEKQNLIRPEHERFMFDLEKDVIYEDKTAQKEWREKFWKMINDIHKRKYDVLLCHELSRLSRNPIDNGSLIKILDKELLQYIQIPTNQFSQSPTDKFTFSLFLAVAKYENDQRWKNTSSWMQSKKQKGWTTNIANMGYINAGESKWNRWIEKDGNNFNILQQAWKKLLTGEYKVIELYRDAVAQWFTRVKSIEGGIQRDVPTDGAFRNAFKNSFYKGYVIVGLDAEAKEVKWNHEPMVTEEEFEKAQIILQKYWFKCSKQTEIKYENLLENILECGKSGNRFYVDLKTRYYCPTEDCSGRYYSANGPKECPKCRKQYTKDKYKIENIGYFALRWSKHMLPDGKKEVSNIPIKYMEDTIDKLLSTISIPESIYNIMRKQLYTLWEQEEEKTNKRINTIKNEIKKLEQKRKNLMQNWLGKEDISEAFIDSIESNAQDILLQIRIKEADIIEIRENNNEGFEIAWQTLNNLLKAKKVFWKWSTEGFEPKRDLLLSLFSNLKFIDGKIIPEWKEPFSIIAQAQLLTKQKSYNTCRIPGVRYLWLPE